MPGGYQHMAMRSIQNFFSRKNRISEIGQKVHTPLTMESGDSLFVTIHEAALVDYAGMALDPKGQNLTCDLVPLGQWRQSNW